MTPNQSELVNQNALVLANASALTYAVIIEMGDQHVSRSINGETLTRDRIESIVAMKLSDAFQSA